MGTRGCDPRLRGARRSYRDLASSKPHPPEIWGKGLTAPYCLFGCKRSSINEERVFTNGLNLSSRAPSPSPALRKHQIRRCAASPYPNPVAIGGGAEAHTFTALLCPTSPLRGGGRLSKEPPPTPPPAWDRGIGTRVRSGKEDVPLHTVYYYSAPAY